jgi:hypothetical protein
MRWATPALVLMGCCAAVGKPQGDNASILSYMIKK